jgi:hypothetical protein
MINRNCKMHPSDYMRHYVNAAKIIMKCSEELTKLPMHPDATPRTYLHWLSVMLGTNTEWLTIGSLAGGADDVPLSQLLDTSKNATID